jgi:cation diffusion facilitator family transporter
MVVKKDMMLAVKISLFSNIFLCAIKAFAVVIVDSLAIAADLGISCVALTVSVILYYSIKMADKPADFLHNYGYSKVENVCELIEGAVLIGLTLAMSFQAIMHIIRIDVIKSPLIGLICSCLGIIINFWGAHFILTLAKKSSSPALTAEGIHFRLEGYISLAITLSFAFYIFVTWAGFFKAADYIDPIATLLVSIIVFIPSIHLLKEAFMKLLDASIGESGQVEVIKVLAKHIDSYCNFKHIKTRTAGRKQFVDLHLIMPEHISLKDASQVLSEIKNDILSTISESDVNVIMEPCKRDCFFTKTNQPCPYVSH